MQYACELKFVLVLYPVITMLHISSYYVSACYYKGSDWGNIFYMSSIQLGCDNVWIDFGGIYFDNDISRIGQRNFDIDKYSDLVVTEQCIL